MTWNATNPTVNESGIYQCRVEYFDDDENVHVREAEQYINITGKLACWLTFGSLLKIHKYKCVISRGQWKKT